MKNLILLGALLYTVHAEPLTPAQIEARQNYIHGYATECMMDSFFMYGQKWKKLEGESGIHGIDGLYIQYRDGRITELLIAESKYNHAHLGWTQKHTIRQMSKKWIVKKLIEAKPHNPQIKAFDRIIALAKKGLYRARLFKLKPLSKGKFQIILYTIKSKNRHITKKRIQTRTIDIHHPTNSFEEAMCRSYLGCKEEGIKRWLNQETPDP